MALLDLQGMETPSAPEYGGCGSCSRYSKCCGNTSGFSLLLC